MACTVLVATQARNRLANRRSGIPSKPWYCCCMMCRFGAARWDYSHDERDNEIAELKKRLVEEQRKTKEAASKAAEELKLVMDELQVGAACLLPMIDMGTAVKSTC